MMKKRFKYGNYVYVILLALICMPQPAVRAGCVSGTCADGYTGCGCDIACCEQRMMGNQSSTPTYTEPGYDYGAEQRALEEANRRAQEEAELQAREEEVKMLEAEKQRKFKEQQAEGIKLLKGNTGTATFGLKGVDPADTGLHEPDRQVNRDLGGNQAAWKQLHCASSITGSALAALNNGDDQEFSYLAGEANKALNGERLGVECKAAPPFPELNGRKVDLDRVRNAERKILERATKAAEVLRKEPTAVPVPQETAPPTEGEDEMESLRRKQAEINRVQERKYDPSSQEAIDREQQAKKELTRLILENKKIEKGDFSIDLGEEPSGDTPKSSKTTEARQ